MIEPVESAAGLPPARAGELRRHYLSLPVGRTRWRCPEGQAFLRLAEVARIEYGTTALAGALEVSVQGVHHMLGQRVSSAAWGSAQLPGLHVVREIKRAHAKVVELRLSGRQARKGTREYRDMHLALMRTMGNGWSLEIIGAVARLPLRELRRFVDPPGVESLRGLALEDCHRAWSDHLAAVGAANITRTGRTFLQLLATTADLGVTRAKIAHRLGMEPERVSLLMSVGMAALRRAPR